jgi:hypothetical protein
MIAGMSVAARRRVAARARRVYCGQGILTIHSSIIRVMMAWTRPGDAGNMPRPRVPLPPFQSLHDIRNFGPCRARLYTRRGRVFTRDSDASLQETRTFLYTRLGRVFTRDSDSHETVKHTHCYATGQPYKPAAPGRRPDLDSTPPRSSEPSECLARRRRP